MYFISAAPGVLRFATEEFLTEVVDGGTPYNGLYRKGVPQRATLFRLLRLLKYMKEYGNVSFPSVKRLTRANRCILWLRKNRDNVLVLLFIHFLTTVHL